jgi:hypothetical protein
MMDDIHRRLRHAYFTLGATSVALIVVLAWDIGFVGARQTPWWSWTVIVIAASSIVAQAWMIRRTYQIMRLVEMIDDSDTSTKEPSEVIEISPVDQRIITYTREGQ